MNTTMIWIKSLDGGAFCKYEDILRKGFERDGITSEDLPSIGQADLAVIPFEIRLFRDRKNLAQYFKALKQNNIAPENEEGAETEYH